MLRLLGTDSPHNFSHRGPQEDVQLYLSHNHQAACTVKERLHPEVLEVLTGLDSCYCSSFQTQRLARGRARRPGPDKPEVLALP